MSLYIYFFRILKDLKKAKFYSMYSQHLNQYSQLQLCVHLNVIILLFNDINTITYELFVRIFDDDFYSQLKLS